MNIKNRTWLPDTCACIITMEMDTDTQTDYAPVQKFTNKEGVESVISFCPLHDTGDLQTSYEACLKTNQTKNQLEGVFNTTPCTRRLLSSPEVEMLKLMKVANGSASSFEVAEVPIEIRHKEYKWEINQNGEVEIDLSSFNAQEKIELETEITKNLANVIIK